MRAILPLVTLLLTGCGGSAERPTPRPDLVGTWDLVAVDGALLPTAAPEEEGIVLDAVAMTLDPSGAYALASTHRGPDRAAPEQTTIEGSWAATERAFSFFSEDGPAVVMFGYRLDGIHLVMTDDAGHDWVLRRR